MENKQKAFREELIKKLAEAAENEVVRAKFFMGEYNAIEMYKEIPQPDYKWAESEMEELEEEYDQKLSMDNVMQWTEVLSEKLHAKIRAELKESFGAMKCHYYSIQAGAIEAEMALAIRRSTEAVCWREE